jgi:putative endonuclease
MYFVYALASENRNYIYVGLSSNLEKRINAHNSGYERTTKPYRPFKLIFSKAFATRTEAREVEKYYKSTSGKLFLKTLL